MPDAIGDGLRHEVRARIGPGESYRFLDLFPQASPKSAGVIAERATRLAIRKGNRDERYFCSRMDRANPVIGRFSPENARAANLHRPRPEGYWAELRHLRANPLPVPAST